VAVYVVSPATGAAYESKLHHTHSNDGRVDVDQGVVDLDFGENGNTVNLVNSFISWDQTKGGMMLFRETK
jgi:hypothetical protein